MNADIAFDFAQEEGEITAVSVIQATGNNAYTGISFSYSVVGKSVRVSVGSNRAAGADIPVACTAFIKP